MSWRHKTRTPKGRILRSRYVMEQHLGRELLPDEVVHHKNDDCRDDRIENLELLSSQSEHASLHFSRRKSRPDHAVCLVCGETYTVRKKGRRPRLYRGKRTGTVYGYCSQKCYLNRGG